MKLGWRPTSHQCLCSFFSRSNTVEKILTIGHRLRVCKGTGQNQNCRIWGVPCLGSCGYRRFLLTGHPHLWVKYYIMHLLKSLPSCHCSKGTASSSLSISEFPSISVSHFHSYTRGHDCPAVSLWTNRYFAGFGLQKWHLKAVTFHL